FISSHIDRCEACRLKYARQAEQATIPYSPLAARRTPAAPQNRSQSRQSVGAGSSNTSMRPSSRASAVSAAPRLQDTGGAVPATHQRSSSTGAPLADARANTKRAVARAAECALADEGPQPPPALPSPPARGDVFLTAFPSDGMPTSPSEAAAARSRSRRPRTATRAAAAAGSSTAARGARRSSVQLSPTRESPASSVRSGHRSGTAVPGFPDGLVDYDYARSTSSSSVRGQAVDLTDALVGSLVDTKRGQDQKLAELEATNARLRSEVNSLQQTVSHLKSNAGTASASAGGDAAEPTNIFDPNSASAKRQALEQALQLDRAALDKFEEFRRAYEECEHSLRSNPVQFAGERPLSPPPARRWGGSSGGAATPMHSALDSSDHDGRLAPLGVAEVRRAAEDLMSTPVRRKQPRTIRATSTRRPTRPRMAQPLFPGEGELRDGGADDSDPDDGGEGGNHTTMRTCLTVASSFGAFLVQYVSRQCLEFSNLTGENQALQGQLKEAVLCASQLDKANRLLEARDEQAYDFESQLATLREKVDVADRSVRRLTARNEKLERELAQSNERNQTLEDNVTQLNASLTKTRQRGEQEIAGLRRSASALQQDKAQLAKNNDELRAELKGKLQRAGLKANIDEYLASRRTDAGAAVAASADTGDVAGSEAEGAAAEGEIKRLQERVQFWRKKTDRIDRKLRTERTAKSAAERMLRILQEETCRYKQMFGPLPHDEALPETMESLAGYDLAMPAPARRGSAQTADPDASTADSDSP
ncbi:hypothetical protein H4R21_004307, partial [Coemansia helicoidea]